MGRAPLSGCPRIAPSRTPDHWCRADAATVLTTSSAPSRNEGSGSFTSGSPTSSDRSRASPSPHGVRGARARGRHDLRRLGNRGLQATCKNPTCSRSPTRTRSRSCPGAARRSRGRMFCDIKHHSEDPFEGDPRYVLKRNLTAHGTRVSRSTSRRRWSSSSSSRRGAQAARRCRLLRPHPARHGERAAASDGRHARSDGHPGRVQLPRARAAGARSTCATPTRSPWPTT